MGPRSAHIAGLRYACFADPAELEGARIDLVAPTDGDPAEYATVHAAGGQFALTATCAANALGLVPDGAHARGSREAALLAFGALADATRGSAQQAARSVLDGATRKIADAVEEAARQHHLDPGFSLVALGGAAGALVGDVAQRVGAEIVFPEHPEVLSSVGAALSLVRAEVTRTPTTDEAAVATPARVTAAREAERACVESGAAPQTVRVETTYEPQEGVVRAVATGAVALETGAAGRREAGRTERLNAAAGALDIDPAELSLLAENDFYLVYSENGSGRVAAVDQHGAVPLAEQARSVFAAAGADFVSRLREEVEGCSVNLGVASMLPRVSLVCGARILDLSDARRADEVVNAAEQLVRSDDGPAVAILAR